MATQKNTRRVSMSDVALKAGVSQSTVSRVINNHPGISRSTRRTVEKAMMSLSYKTSIQPELQQSIVMAMCPLPEQLEPLSLEYFARIAGTARETLVDSPYRFDLRTLVAGAAELPGLMPGDGVILLGFPSEALRESLRRGKVPYIIASGDIYSSTEDMVTVNNFEASVEACRFLLKSGVQRIGFMLTEHDYDRFAGFQAELLRNSLSTRSEDFRRLADTGQSAIIETIHRWIEEGDLPEALVVGSHDAALAVRSLLTLNKIRVPQDVMVVGFDHHPGVRNEFFSIHSDPIRIGRQSAVRMIAKLRNPAEPPLQTVVPMTLEPPRG